MTEDRQRASLSSARMAISAMQAAVTEIANGMATFKPGDAASWTAHIQHARNSTRVAESHLLDALVMLRPLRVKKGARRG